MLICRKLVQKDLRRSAVMSHSRSSYPPGGGRAIDSVVKVESLSQGVTFQDNSTLLGSDYPTSYLEVKQQNYQVPSDGR